MERTINGRLPIWINPQDVLAHHPIRVGGDYPDARTRRVILELPEIMGQGADEVEDFTK